jgi:hypothetical protein
MTSANASHRSTLVTPVNLVVHPKPQVSAVDMELVIKELYSVHALAYMLEMTVSKSVFARMWTKCVATLVVLCARVLLVLPLRPMVKIVMNVPVDLPRLVRM